MSSNIRLIHQNQNPSPSQLICLGHQEDAGHEYSAVAHTQWGDIPGKAQLPSTCWYPYDGEEHITEDFSFVVADKDAVVLVQASEKPKRALPLGLQNDGAGELCLAIANTEWGHIPGKAKDGICWYCYDGKGYETSDFSWICEVPMVKLVHQRENPPPSQLVCFGRQDDSQEYYSAVAHTEWGNIPGKATLPDTCWYPYDGEEHTTDDFSLVQADEDAVKLVRSEYPPSGALKYGYQHNSGEELFLAIADSEWGSIPGKANEGQCWYPYDGKEHLASDFSWVCKV